MDNPTHSKKPKPEGKVDWAHVTKQFNNLHPGEFCIGNNGRYYIKPLQNIAYHLDGILIDLATGDLEHFSNTFGLQPVAWNEINI